MVHHIENNQISSEVLKNKKLVLIDFFATWCMPCEMLAPVLDEMDKKYRESIEIFKVNVDENQESAMRYNIQSIPTILFFKEGEEIERQDGYLDEKEFSKLIESLI
jgi:thioredoxin 1